MRRVGTEVLVIGGGATGAGVALDAALRGFKTLLVEKGDLTHGATGRYHGLLHSGSRYVVNDPQSARECMAENRVLRRIFPQAIEDTGGLFVLLPSDDATYADSWLDGCREAGIPAEEIAPGQALSMEPLLAPDVRRVFRVPDAACDSFDAVRAIARAIRQVGGAVWTRHRVEGLVVDAGRVSGARLTDLGSGEEVIVHADLVVNATGTWAGRVAAMAGCEVDVTFSKGSMLAYALRLVNTVVSRCVVPGDGDCVVPVGTVCVVGTTAVPVEDPDRYGIEPTEVELLAHRGAELVPRLRDARALRTWAGVRPLYQPGGPGDSRRLTRHHTVIDHARRDGVSRFITIVGGKFTTYRLMAEQTVDLICEKFQTVRPCQTAETPLASGDERRVFALGDRLAALESGQAEGALVCECEIVTRPQLERALHENASDVLSDLRRDLRLGMGPCQAAFCATRAAAILHAVRGLPIEEANAALLDLLQARWKGVLPVALGHTLRQVALAQRLYRTLLAADRLLRTGETESYPGELAS